MVILNTTDILSRGGALNGLQRQIQGAQGLQQVQMNAEALRQLQAKGKQDELNQQRQFDLQQMAIDAYNSGDPAKIAELAVQAPEMSKRILAAQGIVNDADLKRVSDRFASVASAADPRATLAASIEQGRAAGLNMADSEAVLNSGMSNDEIRQQALLALASVDQDRAKGIQTALTAGTPEPMTAYQSAMVDQKAIDQDLRAQELELKRLESQARKEKDQLQLDKIQADIAKKEADLNKVKKDKASSMRTSIQNSESLVNAIDNLIMNDDYVDTLTGFSGKVPTILPSSTDADVAFDNVQNILTLDNLSLMSGVLTDRDIAVLRSAASGVEKGMTKDAFLKQMRKIKNRVSTKLRKARSDYDKLDVQDEQVEVTENSSMQQDQNDQVKVTENNPAQRTRSDEEILRQYGIE